jgi:hypothetical protein
MGASMKTYRVTLTTVQVYDVSANDEQDARGEALILHRSSQPSYCFVPHPENIEVVEITR